MVFRDLILNVGLLLALSLLYSYLLRAYHHEDWVQKGLSGLLFGVIAVIGMLVPFLVEDGIVFDGSSIILSIAGFFGGWITGGLAATIATIYRLSIGGSGEISGVGVILTSVMLGVGYRYISQKYPRLSAPFYIYIFGVIVHLVMLAWMLIQPDDFGVEVIRRVAIPVLLVFPLATLVLARMVADQEKYQQTQIELLENETRYRPLFENSSSVMLVVNHKTDQIANANQAAINYYGWSLQEFTTMTISDINVLTSQEIQKEQKLARAENRNFLYSRHRLASGEIRSVEIYTGQTDKSAQELYYTIVHDITERRKAEHALKETQHSFWEMLENLAMIAVMLDENGDITFCNQHLETITGWNCDEVYGKNWFDIFIPADIKSDLLELVFRKTFSTGEVTAHHINEIVTRDGKRCTISWNNTVFRDFEGNVIGTTSLGEDITERNKAERTLRQSERMLANAQRIAQIGSWEWDIESGKVGWTQEVFRIFNLTPDKYSPQIDEFTAKRVQDPPQEVKSLI